MRMSLRIDAGFVPGFMQMNMVIRPDQPPEERANFDRSTSVGLAGFFGNIHRF